ncbi:MAG: class I SAM-dependent methyltransferase [Methylococcaceae bacterium]|jgi:ubiquinone/menaquinone biosynthesis C-methylase UbiE
MNNVQPHFDEALFSGVIGQEYEMLKLICPLAAEMSLRVGQAVSEYTARIGGVLSVLELGGGTGTTTLAILAASENLKLLSVDNEPTMQNQAKHRLQNWVDGQRLSFCGDDALTALKNTPSDSVNIVASAYTLHNFVDAYRQQVVEEIFRVLVPGGQFINADRYALNDVFAHTRAIQKEVSGYFSVLKQLNRIDLLEHWIVHLFSDESENHLMREASALEQLVKIGFNSITLDYRQEVNALVRAGKPAF